MSGRPIGSLRRIRNACKGLTMMLLPAGRRCCNLDSRQTLTQCCQPRYLRQRLSYTANKAGGVDQHDMLATLLSIGSDFLSYLLGITHYDLVLEHLKADRRSQPAQ